MGKIISVMTNKGGNGKTTITTNLAVTLAQQNKKTIIIDLDGACGMQFAFGLTYKDTKNQTIWDIVSNNVDLKDCVMKFKQKDGTNFENLNFIFSDSILRRWEWLVMHNPYIVEKFIKVLNVLKMNYDYVIIDTSGKIEQLNQLVINESDLLLIPFDFDFANIYSQLATLSEINTINENASNKKKLFILNKAKFDKEGNLKLTKANKNLYEIITDFIEKNDYNSYMSQTKVINSSHIVSSWIKYQQPVMMSKSISKTVLKVKKCFEDLTTEILNLLN